MDSFHALHPPTHYGPLWYLLQLHHDHLQPPRLLYDATPPHGPTVLMLVPSLFKLNEKFFNPIIPRSCLIIASFVDFSKTHSWASHSRTGLVPERGVSRRR